MAEAVAAAAVAILALIDVEIATFPCPARIAPTAARTACEIGTRRVVATTVVLRTLVHVHAVLTVPAFDAGTAALLAGAPGTAVASSE